MTGDQDHAGSVARLDRHRAVTASLAGLDDDELAARLDAGTPLGVGIGGRTTRLDVGGVPVFVKRIPLTDLERRPGANVESADRSCDPPCRFVRETV